MANTVFYQAIQKNVAQITWKDIFSEFREKHTKKDLEYALLAGTSLDTATEENMLAKWRKPWIFYPVLKGGLVLIAIFYLIFFLSMNSGGMTNTVFFMTILIPPLIPPLILMLLFWEMNIPRNISIYEMLGMFLLGGLFSFFVTGLLMGVIPSEWHPAFAAFREEPAKLAAVVLFILYFQKKRKIYGLTGLVIGAAVGAGFGAFESSDYALNSVFDAGVVGMITNQILRGIFSLGGHTLFCAPYAAALALGTRNGKLCKESFYSKKFLSAFFISMLLHFVWNGGLPLVQYMLFGTVFFSVNDFISCAIIIVLLWIQTLYVIRQCLYQIVEIGQYQPGSGDRYNAENRYFTISDQKNAVIARPEQMRGSAPGIVIYGNGNGVESQMWRSENGEPLVAGRAADCDIRFSLDARGVSRRHLSIQYTGHEWTVRDLGSTNGTFVSSGIRLSPYTDWKLQSGEIIRLGDDENSLRIEIS